MASEKLIKKRIEKSKEMIADKYTDKMDPLMKAVKAVRSSVGTADVNSIESLEHQRHSQEVFSKLITPASGIVYTRESIVTNDSREIAIEWARPEMAHRTDKIIMYCHGGGYTSGGLGYAAILSGKLALYTGLEVISFDYRLAPENPYPAALEDAISVWDHLMYLGYGAKDVYVAGDSAGGNMALELSLSLRQTGRKLPGAHILMSPWTDMTVTSPAYEKYKDVDPLLTKEYILGVRKAYYVPENVEDDSDINKYYEKPELSPLFADLKGLPPTFIQVGSNEILRGDSESLAKKLSKAGVVNRIEVYNGGWHVFQQMPIARAYHALEDIRVFLEQNNL